MSGVPTIGGEWKELFLEKGEETAKFSSPPTQTVFDLGRICEQIFMLLML